MLRYGSTEKRAANSNMNPCLELGPLDGRDGGGVGALSPSLVHNVKLGEGVSGEVAVVAGKGFQSPVPVHVVLHLGPRLEHLMRESAYAGFFCTRPKKSVLVFQELRSKKSSKTQFLLENSVPEQWIYENFHKQFIEKDNFRHFLPENLQIFRKLSSKKAKTQFSRNF